MSPCNPCVFCLTPSGYETAQRIAKLVDGSLHVPEKLASKIHDAAYENFGDAIREAFIAEKCIIGVCASGILIRLLAPIISSKHIDPPVLCIAEDRSSVIPLLGGHNGANKLATELARDLSSHAAITTASELIFGVALDNPPQGWRLVKPAETKKVTSAILSGQNVQIGGYADWLAPLGKCKNVKFNIPTYKNAEIVIQPETDSVSLVYHKQEFYIGVGCSRYCPSDDLVALVGRTLKMNGIASESIYGICSVTLKSDELALQVLAENLDVPLRFYTPDRLEEELPRIANPSKIVFDEVGTHSVAEAACLCAAGPDGQLIISKQKAENATCAIAHSGNRPGDPGHQRGILSIVGIGPGWSGWRTQEASCAIAKADYIVGYKLYLDLIKSSIVNKNCASFKLGEEEERCIYALELAGKGHNVALICSGDSGIYAMSSLVMELLSRGKNEDRVSESARRCEIKCIPGISAMQAASARAGALLGHDFCTISLSDLLTPRETIIQRIEHAASGNFVIALYNPASRRRKTLLPEAINIILKYRSINTPILIARSLGRSDEQINISRLSDFNSSKVDMLTTLIIGNNESQIIGDTNSNNWMAYTPRGYSKNSKA